MTRTAARAIAVQLGFCVTMNPAPVEDQLDAFFNEEHYLTLEAEDRLFFEYPGEKELEYIKSVVQGVASRREELDSFIEKYSQGWKVGRISKTALAVMRIALFEVLYMDEVPPSAAINEAIELSKGYDEAETTAFINGILGSFMRGEIEPAPQDCADSLPGD